VIETEDYHVFRTSDQDRALIDSLVKASRTSVAAPAVVHALVSVRYASTSLPDDDYFGWHWKCTCGAEASPWIQNWPQSEDEAREEWRLHFE
jgi:hypothetical protein